MSVRDKIWTFVLIGLVATQLLISVFMQRGITLTIFSDLLYGTLILLAAMAFIPNVVRAPTGTRSRLFWILMSASMFLWLAYQLMWNYFEVFLRREVPNIFAGDIVLFLHLVPMIAAVALRPHQREGERSARLGMLDFVLLSTWWLFLYVHTVIPWQYVHPNETLYSNNYNQVYLTEKLVLLLALVYSVYSSRGGWRGFYGQLMVAVALYASSSYVANWAIGRDIYYSGSIYDIPLTLSIAWIAFLGRFAHRYSLEESDRNSQPLLAVWIMRFAMLAVFSLPWLALVSELDKSSPVAVRTFRVTLSLLTLVLMGAMVFWRQRLLAIELSRLLSFSRNSYENLQSLQEQLLQSEKLASLGRLVGGAAHEINNPLAAMLGYSDLLSSSDLRPEEKRLAAHISEQVRRTRSLVANLLSFASQSPSRWSASDLNSIVQTALRLLQPQLESQSIATQVEMTSSLPLVTSDSNQLLHVTLHLAGLVCGHTNVDTPATLHVETRNQGNWVVVELTCDCSPNLKQPWQLFDGDAIEKCATLSLSACSRIVKEHGGRIFIRSSSDGISGFRVQFPPTVKSAAQSARGNEITEFRTAAAQSS